MTNKLFLFFVCLGMSFTMLGVSVSIAQEGGLQVLQPRCEYRHDPLGIDELHPRFTWLVDSEENGQLQTAYQILVASTPDKLARGEGDLWDTGKFASGNTVNVAYEGSPLESRQRCYWKVRSWDQNDSPSAWSDVCHWSMGLLKEEDWSARYISYRDTTPIYKDRSGHFLPAARQYR